MNPFPAEKGIGPAYIQGNQAGPFSQKTYPWTKPSTLGGAEGLSRGPASRSRAGVGCAGALDPRASAPQAVRRDRRVGPGRLGPLPWGAPGPPSPPVDLGPANSVAPSRGLQQAMRQVSRLPGGGGVRGVALRGLARICVPAPYKNVFSKNVFPRTNILLPRMNGT